MATSSRCFLPDLYRTRRVRPGRIVLPPGAGDPSDGLNVIKRKIIVMLRNTKSLYNFELRARDGILGKVKDFFFDDLRWNLRYAVVDAGAWLASRNVLISTAALTGSEWDNKILDVALTKEQVKGSPSVDTEEPVSREDESTLNRYYGWPNYWVGGYGVGGVALSEGVAIPVPEFAGAGPVAGVAIPRPMRGRVAPDGDPALRSADEVTGYHIEALDGSIGHVEDFLVDDRTWDVRYIVIDTRNWLPGKKVVISPEWIGDVKWSESTVYIDLPREDIERSPTYDESKPMSFSYSESLHDHYERPHYPKW